jgi:hypothetical protein
MTDELDLGVLGYTGLKQQDGIISEEWHPKLRGAFGPKVYREMADNSSAIGAILWLIETLTKQVEWRVEAVSTEEPAVAAAQFLEECLYDMSHTFEDFLSEVISMFPYGWSYFETVYKIRKGGTSSDPPSIRSKYDDGRVGWRKFALRAQDTLDRWEFDSEDNGLRGMWQSDPSTGKRAFIPIEKSVLFRTSVYKNNPEGRSIFRNAVLDWFFLKRICEIEAVGIERDMTGLLVMEVPMKYLSTSATSDQRALRTQIETMLSQLKRDEREFALVPCEQDDQGKPTGFKLKLLSSGGSRQINTTLVKDYYKIGILQSVLAQFIQLGMNDVGSYALASSQTNTFSMSLGAFLDSIAATFNRFAVARLMEVNGFESEYWPEVVHGDIETPPLAEIGAYVQSLAASGQLPDDEKIKRKLLEIGKLPQPETVEGAPSVPSEPKMGGLRKSFAKDPPRAKSKFRSVEEVLVRAARVGTERGA